MSRITVLGDTPSQKCTSRSVQLEFTVMMEGGASSHRTCAAGVSPSSLISQQDVILPTVVRSQNLLATRIHFSTFGAPTTPYYKHKILLGFSCVYEVFRLYQQPIGNLITYSFERPQQHVVNTNINIRFFRELSDDSTKNN